MEVWDSQISQRIRSFTANNQVTRDETSHFFRGMSLPCLCQLGETEIRCKEETGSQNACTNLFKHILFWNKKTAKTATQNMKRTKYLFRFVAVTNFRKWMDCFGFIFQNLRCASIRVCCINLFRRTLRNLLYEEGLPTTGGPSNKGIVASQKRHPALSFDSQLNRLSWSESQDRIAN